MNCQSQKVNYRVGERDFKYYIFDWDDNILHMPTRIHLERKLPDGRWVRHSVSTAIFAVVRNDRAHYRPPDGDWEAAFAEFQDNRSERESLFLTDTRTALQRVLKGEAQPGLSFSRLKESLIEGRLFAIVTARGHEPESLKQAVRLFIDLVLTPEEREEMMANLRGYRFCFDHITSFAPDEEELDYYLSLNRYHAVTHPKFKQLLRSEGVGLSSESAKQFAIRDFVEHVIRVLERTGADALKHPVSVGFSDDDQGNVQAVKSYICEELSKRFPGIKFCIYDTSDPSLGAGRKVVVSGQLDFGF